MRVQDYKKVNEGFSFWDERELINSDKIHNSVFSEFCKRHNIKIDDKKLYELCDVLYEKIVRYTFDLEKRIRDKSEVTDQILKAIRGIRTFLYNRDETTEFFTKYPTGAELHRLGTDLFILRKLPSAAGYNFADAAQLALGLLSEYKEQRSTYKIKESERSIYDDLSFDELKSLCEFAFEFTRSFVASGYCHESEEVFQDLLGNRDSLRGVKMPDLSNRRKLIMDLQAAQKFVNGAIENM